MFDSLLMPRSMRAFLPVGRLFDPQPGLDPGPRHAASQDTYNLCQLPLTWYLVIMFTPVLIIRPSSASPG